MGRVQSDNTSRLIEVAPGWTANTKMWGELGMGVQPQNNDITAVIRTMLWGKYV